jgi:hypothetical protein
MIPLILNKLAHRQILWPFPMLMDNPRGGYEASRFKRQMDALDETARPFFKAQYFS